ncbi:thiamine pyrophosphate-dependent dehydrogenase E1 component subunit alpha [Verrucosispora sp. WMMD573]|uniref:thiamine pyrophosphate-dependent dehydrogenase E1 component subunit alpha n=1 Tax=Verrucosispora sp. WMMD573 TaxID=3015149 RepID=UPI00248BD008|nr:thiamine pyrophosphate-dependent dehydrogenase E1 component subunit alpha [Verrucosispora sp. WMMD573]WBB53728.1 thiamine pyrophosphate-dependent dehydrogenase E1 component subunit alpha [Verrucosispora sp. WMMD573]
MEHSPFGDTIDRVTQTVDADLELLLLIRCFEEKLLELFAAGVLSGTTHTSIGQEHVAVAVAPLLSDGDFVFSNHRGHAHYLARFPGDAAGLLAEIAGRQGAVCHGVGGSQHLHRGRYVSTGVQGESVALAVGAALHQSQAGDGGLACAFIGDGTFGQGVVYESLNLASLWRLPLVLVVEHNGIAQTTPTGAAMSGTIGARAAAFDVDHLLIDSSEVAEVRAAVSGAVRRVRQGRPLVVECRVPRLGPHSRGDDTRSGADLKVLRELDWLARYRRRRPDIVDAMMTRARARVDGVAADVLSRPLSGWTPR